MKYLRIITALLWAISLAGMASATVLTFDSIDGCISVHEHPSETFHEEAGYQVTARNGSCFGGFNNIHMVYDGEGSHYHDAVTISRVDGGLFDVRGFDIDTFDYINNPRLAGLVVQPGNNFVISGYRDGVQIYSVRETFLTGSRYLSLEGFTGVDELRFDPLDPCECVLNYEYLFYDHLFSVDNLDVVEHVASVPLPSAAGGLVLGLALLGGFARRRR